METTAKAKNVASAYLPKLCHNIKKEYIFPKIYSLASKAFCRTSEIEGKEGSRTTAPSSCSSNIQPFLSPQVVSVEMIFSLDYLEYLPRMPLASRARVYADVNSHRLQAMQ